MKSEVLALIPARGGSKGIPRKNLINLLGKPLIAWSIEQAISSSYIDRVIVSTDDEEIKEVAGKLTIPKKSGDFKKNFKIIITDLFDKEEILNILTDTNIIKIVGDYLGTEPYLNNADVWWDRYVDEDQIDSRTYHFDGNDPLLLKVFFYLTDVSEKDGPFTYISKTHKFVNKFGLIYKHSMSGISDSNISSNTLSNVKKFTGKAGDVIFADTNGLHKGSPISNNSLGRILLTFTFVSRWPKADPPEDKLLPFISASELLSGSYRNYL